MRQKYQFSLYIFDVSTQMSTFGQLVAALFSFLISLSYFLTLSLCFI